MWLTVFGTVESLVFYIFAAVTALNLVLALATLIIGCCFRNVTPGSSMDFYISFGCLALLASLLIRGLNTTQVGFQDFHILCQFFPSIATFGLIWVVGALLIKASAIFNFYRYHHGEKPRKYEWKPNVWMVLLMLVDVIIVLVWVIKFAPQARSPADGRTDVYLCRGYLNPEFQLGVSAYHAVLLLLAAILVWPAVHYAKKTSSSADSTILSLIIYNLVFVVIAGALVFYFVTMDEAKMYAIVGGIMQYGVFATLLGLLVGKILTARRDRATAGEELYDQVDSDKGATNNRFSASSGSAYLTSQNSVARNAEGDEENFTY